MGRCNRRKGLSLRVRASLVCVFLSTPCLFAPATAHAACRQAQERAARKACLSGDYAKGGSLLSDLFIDTKDPTYIFNQARCFEQNRRYEDAIARFQEYLRAAPDLDSSDKAAAEKHSTDCQDLITKQTGHSAAPVVPTAPIQPSVTQEQPRALPAQATPTTIAPVLVVEHIQFPSEGTFSRNFLSADPRSHA